MNALALVLLIVIGYFPARMLTGTRGAAAMTAPIAAALLVTLCAMACAATRLPMTVTLALTTVVSVGCAVRVVRGAVAPRPAARPADATDSPIVLCVIFGALIPFMTVLQAPVGWDARSIWWFHAKWWAEGGTALVSAMQNPAYAFSHSDYPPLASATIGAVWSLFGTRSLELAQFVTAVLGASAVATLAVAFWRLFAGRLRRGRVTFVACVVAAACYGVAEVDTGTNGSVDFLWATAFAAAAVFLLASPRNIVNLRWGALTLGTAALTKNEALIAAVVLASFAIARWRHVRHSAVWMGASIAPGIVWFVLAHLWNAQSEDHWRVTQLLRLEPSVTERIRPTVTTVWDEVALMVLVALALTIAGLLRARVQRSAVSDSAFPWMWCAWAASLGPVVLAYVVSNRDLDWHLATSVARTTLAANLVLLVEIAIWTSTFAWVSLETRAHRRGSEHVLERTAPV